MQRLFSDIEKVAPIGRHGAAPGGERDGQGARRALDPREERPARAARSSRSTPRRSPSRWPSPSSSATRRAPSPAPSRPSPGRFELAHRRNALPGRDRHALAGRPVQAPARARDAARSSGSAAGGAIPVDFRLISATNEDLEARVAAGTFREDLFYRINTIPIRIPPLRERADDIPLLADHFLEKFSARHEKPRRKLSAGVLDRLRAHPWKGNVRELEHVIEMLVLFSDRRQIGEEDLPRVLRQNSSSLPPEPHGPHSFAKAVEDFERKLLTDAIAESGGVKAEAARRLGLDGNQIKYLCRKYGI